VGLSPLYSSLFGGANTTANATAGSLATATTGWADAPTVGTQYQWVDVSGGKLNIASLRAKNAGGGSTVAYAYNAGTAVRDQNIVVYYKASDMGGAYCSYISRYDPGSGSNYEVEFDFAGTIKIYPVASSGTPLIATAITAVNLAADWHISITATGSTAITITASVYQGTTLLGTASVTDSAPPTAVQGATYCGISGLSSQTIYQIDIDQVTSSIVPVLSSYYRRRRSA